MDISSLFTLLFVFLLIKSSSAKHPLKCDSHTPEIRFPFRIQSVGQEHCSLSNFNLFCKNNKTVIRFPDYGDLLVKSISYDTKRLQLVDPKSCVHEVFLNLNLTHTPFSYYYVLKQYKYINCSSEIASFVQVPCLTGSTYYVYVLEPSSPVPISCKPVKTVAIPFSYSPYLSDNSFGLELTWDLTDHEHNEEATRRTERYIKVLGITAFIFMTGMLLYATIRRYNKDLEAKRLKSKSKTQEAEVGKLLGEYEALVPAIDTKLMVYT